MAAVNGSVKDLHAQIEQRDAAMATMQGQLEQVVEAWRTKLEATRCEARASKAALTAQLQASQEAVQRERAAYGQLRQERDDAERKCSKVEKEASLTHSLKQQHWQAIKTAEVLRAEVSEAPAASKPASQIKADRQQNGHVYPYPCIQQPLIQFVSCADCSATCSCDW